MRVSYDSSNSGGRWWLKDADWQALEKAGWNVMWGGTIFCAQQRKNSKFKIENKCSDKNKCLGHPKVNNLSEASENRWLGAVATKAWKDFPSIESALKEFESITYQQVSDEGCNCCGAPHSFSWKTSDGYNEYASGENCLKYLYPNRNIPTSLREAIEQTEY